MENANEQKVEEKKSPRLQPVDVRIVIAVTSYDVHSEFSRLSALCDGLLSLKTFEYPTKLLLTETSRMRRRSNFLHKQSFSVDIRIYAIIVKCRNESGINKSRKRLSGVRSEAVW